MKVSKTKQDKILSVIGLKRHMVWPAPTYVVYDESKFKSYVSSEYRDSERKQSDEFYRMFEITLLHKDSGLRIGYTTTESYDGETVEYKLIDIFIITLKKERLEIVDVDFKKEVFFTTNNLITFAEINRLIE